MVLLHITTGVMAGLASALFFFSLGIAGLTLVLYYSVFGMVGFACSVAGGALLARGMLRKSGPVPHG